MRPLVTSIESRTTPETVVSALRAAAMPGVCLLRSGGDHGVRSRYSFVTAKPFLTFRSSGSRCEIVTASGTSEQFGNPWHLLDALMSQYELMEEIDVPFPTGGCFGYWGYDLKHFTEPKLRRSAGNDLELPDSCVGFYDSVVAFDHYLGQVTIVSTGLNETGSRDQKRCAAVLDFWCNILRASACAVSDELKNRPFKKPESAVRSELGSLSRAEFIARVQRAQQYIQAGDIYQVNLARRIESELPCSPWELFNRWSENSPAPFSAFLDCDDFQIVSASPEMFLRMSGSHITTRPIKGTRGRSADPNHDAQLSYELQTSAKETAELIMITDLLRNDLGRVSEFGSIKVPELIRLERYPHVQHLVSTVEGSLRDDVSHFAAFASCFPGGSITGAPKFRAMEIIDELEPVSRGPYTGALGYLGFNRESQLSIIIRTAICKADRAWFYTGAGIVADSDPEMEYEETETKARGFLQALHHVAADVRRQVLSSEKFDTPQL